MKTKAAVLRNVGGPLTIEELEIPKLKKGQVLIKILYSGLCHSNLNEINGWKGVEFIPHLTGHEASGVILEIGEGVSKVRTGDYVVCSWIKGSGLDAPAVKYQSGKGPINAGACSTFIEYAVVSENRITIIAKEIEPSVAAILGCAVQVGGAIVDKLGIKLGQKLAVFGIGGIGASALMRAVSLGIDCVALDIVPWKLCWAERELNVEATNFELFKAAKHKNVFDFAIECSGSKAAMEIILECLKIKGTAIIAGNLKPEEKISIDYWEFLTGKTLRGTSYDMCFPDLDIPFYASQYLDGLLPINKLITEIYAFDEIDSGLKNLELGKLIRGIVKLSNK